MIKYYMMAIELGGSTAMNNLDVYYENTENYDEMIKYYMMAIEILLVHLIKTKKKIPMLYFEDENIK